MAGAICRVYERAISTSGRLVNCFMTKTQSRMLLI
jgi:hypothetical protein